MNDPNLQSKINQQHEIKNKIESYIGKSTTPIDKLDAVLLAIKFYETTGRKASVRDILMHLCLNSIT